MTPKQQVKQAERKKTTFVLVLDRVCTAQVTRLGQEDRVCTVRVTREARLAGPMGTGFCSCPCEGR
jgi:hypothetical protein